MKNKKPKKLSGQRKYKFPCPWCEKAVVLSVKTEVLKKAVPAEKAETCEAHRDTQVRLN